MQIGKASAVAPVLGAEFGRGLGDVSVYIALFSLGAALLGLPLALVAQRFGALRAGVAGLLLIALASLAGAAAQSWDALLIFRLMEAIGLPLVVATMPGLMQAAAGPERRHLIGGLWATWLPLGVALALLLSVPLLGTQGGWRALFLWSGIVPLAAVAGLLVFRPAALPARGGSEAPRHSGGLIVMALAFLLFSVLNMILTGFLPLVAESELRLGLSHSALYGASAASLIILGNILATWLMARGWAPYLLLMGSFIGMGLCAAMFLLDAPPVPVRIFGGIGFQLCAGVAPGVIWAQVPRLMQVSGRSAPFVSGAYYQAAGLGQFAGPILAAAVVQATGNWGSALAVIGPVAALGMACAVLAMWRAL